MFTSFKDFENSIKRVRHSEKKTKRSSLDKCPCCGENVSNNSDELYWVGSHVEDKERNTYITPTCNRCNSKYKEGKADEKWFYVTEHHLCQYPKGTQEC